MATATEINCKERILKFGDGSFEQAWYKIVNLQNQVKEMGKRLDNPAIRQAEEMDVINQMEGTGRYRELGGENACIY